MKLNIFSLLFLVLASAPMWAKEILLSNNDLKSLIYGIVIDDLSKVDISIPVADVREFDFTSGFHLVSPTAGTNTRTYEFFVRTTDKEANGQKFSFRVVVSRLVKAPNDNFLYHLQESSIEKFVITQFIRGKKPRILAVRSDRELDVFKRDGDKPNVEKPNR